MPKELQDSADEFGIVFGNWYDYFIGQWGGLEVRVDPYTLMLDGYVRLMIRSFWNMGMIRPESFSIASLK